MPSGNPKLSRSSSASAQSAQQIKFLLGQATTLLKSGQARAAEGYFRQLLVASPAHPQALKWLGVIAFQSAQFAKAVEWWQQALAVTPQDGGLHNNLGLALQQLGQSQSALESMDRALALQPDFVEALNNRGNVLRDLQRMEDAAASYRKAIVLQPKFADCQHNLAMTLIAMGQPLEALDWLERCLKLVPQHPGASFLRAVALAGLNRQGEALALFDHVVKTTPENAEAHAWQCKLLVEAHRLDEALVSCQRAVRLFPNLPESHFNLGTVLVELNQREQALVAFNRALELRPDYLEALSNKGGALQDLRRHEEAAIIFARLLALSTDYNFRLQNLFHARQFCADWSQYAEHITALETAVLQPNSRVVPFNFLTVSGKPALQLACARAYAEKWHPPIARTPLNTATLNAARSRHARLRVAYVSADFTEHAVSYLLAGVFEAHDRSQFETIVLRLKASDGSAMAQRVDKAFERTIDVSGMTDAEAAAKMVEQEVDIAVDLTGFTENSRTSIFASHPAPIQINYLGYPGTMGTPHMDFILADEYVIPPEAAAQYSEKVAYLPDCFQANDDKRGITQPAPSRSEAGLPPTGFVFCAFNSIAKLNPPLFNIWLRLLAAVPDSVLWLIASEPTARRNLIAQAEQRGIAAHRLVFAPHIRYPDHLARMGLADLFLDTLPFNAGTTASDALWAGLPVLTCSGEAFAARMAGSLLRAVGLQELIARDLQHYEALALALATRPEELATVRARLAANRASAALFDTKRFCRNLEMAYCEMWAQYERGEAPATFRVQVRERGNCASHPEFTPAH